MNKISNIDEYITTYSKEIQEKLQSIRKLVSNEAPADAVEAMSYWVPAFKLNWKNLIVFAAFKNHIGIYPEPEAIEKFKEELRWYKTSKWAIQIPYGESLPFDLIKKIISFKLNAIKY